jgi:hypothetical protein
VTDDVAPVRPFQAMTDTPWVVRVDPPGQPGWVMTPGYARLLAACLLGAVTAVEVLNGE